MAGGATGGDCAIGSLVMDNQPTTMMNKAITHAKMGRSMKNLAMDAQPFFAWEAAGTAADAGLAAAEAGAAALDEREGGSAADPAGTVLALQRTAFTGAPGRTFWKPSTITCSPAVRP